MVENQIGGRGDERPPPHAHLRLRGWLCLGRAWEWVRVCVCGGGVQLNVIFQVIGTPTAEEVGPPTRARARTRFARDRPLACVSLYKSRGRLASERRRLVGLVVRG